MYLNIQQFNMLPQRSD